MFVMYSYDIGLDSSISFYVDINSIEAIGQKAY